MIGKAKKEIEVLFWSFKISSLTSFELGSILEKVSLSECSGVVSRASVPPRVSEPRDPRGSVSADGGRWLSDRTTPAAQWA